MSARVGLFAFFFALTPTLVAFASPTPEVAVNGPVVNILTSTGDENCTCVYTISVTFTDGSKHDQRGQIDPPAKCQDCVSASWNLGKAIGSAQLSRWQCS